MKTKTHTMTFEAGRLLCGRIRFFFESLKFQGYNIDFLESSGLLARTFTVRGSLNDLEMIRASLEKWREEINP